jgi:hypothetical protein
MVPLQLFGGGAAGIGSGGALPKPLSVMSPSLAASFSKPTFRE